MTKRIAILISLLTMFAVQAWSQFENYPYVVVINRAEDKVVSDSVFYMKARGIQFKVGKTDIPENSPFCRELIEDVLPKLDPDKYHLEFIKLRGAASPEGSYELNTRLGKGRKQAILDFVVQNGHFHISPKLIAGDDIAEDYPGLLRLMKQAADPDYEAVKGLVDKYLSTNPKKLKTEMQKARGGKLWKRLLEQYFPELRTAKVMLFFRENHVEFYPAPIEKVDLALHQTPDLSAPRLNIVIPKAEVPTDEPRRELLSVKTNLLFDFAYVPGYDRWCPIPNVAIEYYPLHGHVTWGASIDFPWWQHYWDHKYFQIRNYQVEGRYYFRSGDVDATGYGNGPAFRGFYVKAYAHAGLFSICFDENRGWEGEGAGAGLGLGTVIPLGKQSRWRLELGLQAGYFRCKYDPYQYECPVNPDEQDHLYYYKWKGDASLFKKRQYRWSWLGPTRAEITLTYDLLFRKRHKGGVSFNSIEKGGQR